MTTRTKNIRNKFNFKKFFNKLWKIVYKTIWTFNFHNGIANAGYLSFSLLFAIFPFIIFFMLLVSSFGNTDIGVELINVLQENLPDDIVGAIFPVIEDVVNVRKGGMLSIATITLIWSASSIVQTITGILNSAYRIRNTKIYFINRARSIILFLFMIIFIITIIFITTILPRILNLINAILFIKDFNNNLFGKTSSVLLHLFLLIFVEFIYYFIPSKRKMKFKDTIYGAILTVTGWMIIGKILVFYWSKISNFNAVYGSFTGIFISLFFFNIMSMIFIFGAEFNYSIYEKFGNYNKKLKK
ncbi:MAG: YihY/virulence factor BrkB family protein [Rickettsiales bacterium]|jgi:membrane protein|nr:YihY/virulence factor BrkB family protein [Rickettsiales bacterium]